jgi:hypothetical protein
MTVTLAQKPLACVNYKIAHLILEMEVNAHMVQTATHSAVPKTTELNIMEKIFGIHPEKNTQSRICMMLKLMSRILNMCPK